MLGHVRLRENIVKLFFEKQTRKRKRSIERNVAPNQNLRDILPKDYHIIGISSGSFLGLLRNIINIRIRHRGDSLPFIERNGVVAFFSLFNKEFRNVIPNIDRVIQIKCHIVDENVNDTWGYHGIPGRGTAFLFHILLKSGERKFEQYCLGRGCQNKECSEEHYSV